MNLETEIALERLAEAKGIALAKNGKVLVAPCPLGVHDDDATFEIDPKANTWECTAGCGSGGVVEFVAKIEGVSVTHAAELLKSEFDPTPSDGPLVKNSTKERLDRLVNPDEPDEVVLANVLRYYAETFKTTPKALAYLHDRGIQDPELVGHFGLGFADRTLGYRLPHRGRRAGTAIRDQLRRIGILRDTGHERFRGSIVVPLYDLAGRVVQAYGRKITHKLRAGTEYHVTLNEGDRGVLNPAGFVDGQRVILTFGVVDALTWWSWGFRNVTSTIRATTLPPDVKALLVAKKIRSVCLAFPREHDTGEIAADLRELGIEAAAAAASDPE